MNKAPSVSQTPSATAISQYPDAESRELYKTLFIDGGTAYDKWIEEYKEAVEAKAHWVSDSQEVALRFLPSIYGVEWPGYREKVYFLEPTAQDTATYIIVVAEADDSISSTKYRIELSQRDNFWKITWVGRMHRCARGSQELQTNWHTEPCP